MRGLTEPREHPSESATCIKCYGFTFKGGNSVKFVLFHFFKRKELTPLSSEKKSFAPKLEFISFRVDLLMSSSKQESTLQMFYFLKKDLL